MAEAVSVRADAVAEAGQDGGERGVHRVADRLEASDGFCLQPVGVDHVERRSVEAGVGEPPHDDIALVDAGRLARASGARLLGVEATSPPWASSVGQDVQKPAVSRSKRTVRQAVGGRRRCPGSLFPGFDARHFQVPVQKETSK
ncbi:hypothetical protein [Streptomyces sp. NPDC001502]|uniref:hypothetical protein n=1 Tax=Streptomyces sp. NPDC001502 TaxID=3364578 RepID=UPI0036AFF62E